MSSRRERDEILLRNLENEPVLSAGVVEAAAAGRIKNVNFGSRRRPDTELPNRLVCFSGWSDEHTNAKYLRVVLSSYMHSRSKNRHWSSEKHTPRPHVR